MNTITATKAYLEARKALEQAELIKKQAEATLKAVLASQGVDFSVADGVKVTIVKGERPNYDAEALKALIAPETLETVTKLAVDGKKFQSAVSVGLITPEVAQAVTKVTEYEQFRVTELAGAKADAPAISKVA